MDREGGTMQLMAGPGCVVDMLIFNGDEWRYPSAVIISVSGLVSPSSVVLCVPSGIPGNGSF